MGVNVKLPDGYTYWDPTKRLKDIDYARLYVEACSEEDPGDGNVIRASLQDVTRAQNMSGLAQQVGMSRAGLYKTLSPNGNPSFATIMRLTRALGMQVVIRPHAHREIPSPFDSEPESEDSPLSANLETPYPLTLNRPNLAVG